MDEVVEMGVVEVDVVAAASEVAPKNLLRHGGAPGRSNVGVHP